MLWKNDVINMKYKSNNLEELQYEVLFVSPFAEPTISPLSLYHYTSHDSKSKIVNEETGSVNFRLTKASDFQDKNEGTHILEPYLHACGSLYDQKIIDHNFYHILKNIKASDIVSGIDDIWILCLTAEGYSRHMKERYAPNDGWLIELHKLSFDDLIFCFNTVNCHNHIRLVEVQYSYQIMKEQLEEVINKLFDCYRKDDTSTKEAKQSMVIKIIKSYLSQCAFGYKSDFYKNEKEIRLVIHMSTPFDQWSSNDIPGTSLYFEDNYLYLRFEKNCYVRAMQQPDIYNAIELNKSFITGIEIREALTDRSQEFKL